MMFLSKEMQKYVGSCATVLAISTACFPAFADTASDTTKSVTKETSIKVNQNVVVFEGRMSLGWLNGEANEYVNLPAYNHRLSELTYKLKDVFMLGLGGSVAPLSWLKFNGDVWFKLNSGNGTMNDYDWMTLDSQYTDWSHHTDVDLTKGFMLDVNAEFKFYQWEKSKFFGAVGFKYDNFEWEVRGGDYVYSSYYYYDTVGSFPDGQLVLTYEQKYYAPYLGIGFRSDLDQTPITFSGRIIGSFFVWADSTDQHHLRDLVSDDSYNGGNMLGIDLNGAYNFTKHFSLMLSYHYLNYSNFEDNSHRKDLTTGQLTVYNDAKDGMDFTSHMVALTALFTF